MFYSPQELHELSVLYCESNNIQLLARLGRGLQGVVYKTSRRTAIKTHYNLDAFEREKVVYQRLQEHSVVKVRDIIVPQFINFDDKSKIIEMTLVAPPFIVDFGGSYLDNPPQYAYDPRIRAELETEKKEQFGNDWELVRSIIADFETLYGVILLDVHPGNIRIVS